jgi:hypothetical protein
VSHDKHLRVAFSPFKMPPRTEPTPEDEARFHQQMEHDNCAFDKVEILPNNIGYVKFDGFMDASFRGPTVVAAMGFVAHPDAHLIDIYNRKEDSTTELDAVVPAGTKAEEAAGVCAYVETDVLRRRGVRIRSEESEARHNRR